MKSLHLHVGPNIDYLRFCLRFWDEHLKGKKDNSKQDPNLRVYVQDTALHGECDVRSGRWLQMDGWSKERVNQSRYVIGSSELSSNPEIVDDRTIWQHVPFSMQCGQAHGEWLHFGFKGQSASDQRASDAYSFCSTSSPLERQIAILGFAEVHCTVRVLNSDRGMLAARLVDVWPNGSATLITYGLLNLTHMRSHDEASVHLLKPGEEYDVTVKLHSCGYVVPKGHQLRLSLSACYWPNAWPTNKPVEMEVKLDRKKGEPCSWLTIPEVKEDTVEYKDELFTDVTNPAIGTPLEFKYLTQAQNEYTNQHDVINEAFTKTIVRDGGLRHFRELGAAYQHRYTEKFICTKNDPATATSQTHHENRAQYDDVTDEEGNPIKILVTSSSELTSQGDDFQFVAEVKASLNQEVIFEKKWNEKIGKRFI